MVLWAVSFVASDGIGLRDVTFVEQIHRQLGRLSAAGMLWWNLCALVVAGGVGVYMDFCELLGVVVRLWWQ